MSIKYFLASSLLIMLLIGCDSQKPKVEAIDHQSKTIQCTLNGKPFQMDINQGSLEGNLYIDGKELRFELLKFSNEYQIIIRFDPEVGQLKFNQANNQLFQLRYGQERLEPCTTQVKST